jgi:hypothetical protein
VQGKRQAAIDYAKIKARENAAKENAVIAAGTQTEKEKKQIV